MSRSVCASTLAVALYEPSDVAVPSVPTTQATPDGDGFTVLDDAEVSLASKGDSKLPIRLRRLTVMRHDGGGIITLLTNDLDRSAVEIAALYKGR